MNLNFFEFDTLQEELKQLPTPHQLAFAASVCERLLPNYKMNLLLVAKIQEFS
ncbi:DUF416 family protein [Nostoc sp.]|uniref:DUF416 family protein n=1 Tax=Nostoc sp. TaxID=1180 RepID=UPI002FF658A8